MKTTITLFVAAVFTASCSNKPANSFYNRDKSSGILKLTGRALSGIAIKYLSVNNLK